jgi:hypothetical protein
MIVVIVTAAMAMANREERRAVMKYRINEMHDCFATSKE